MPIKIQNLNPYVVVHLNGVPARFILDTGSGFLAVDRTFAVKNGVARSGDPFTSTMINREDRTAMLGDARTLSIGGHGISPMPMALVDFSGFATTDDALPFGGLLGAEALIRNAAIIDFGNLKLYLKPR